MRKTFKKIVAGIILATSIFTTQSAFAWGIVFDPTAVAQAIQMVAQLQQQYEQLKNQTEAMSGSYNVGSGLNKVNDILPGSWQDVVSTQKGAFGTKQETYDKLMKVVSDQALTDMMSNNKTFKDNYNNVRMGMAVSNASYEALNEHIKNLNILSAKINSTKNIKEAQDLANQIAIEQGFITAINARLGAIQSNMTASMSNGSVSSAQKLNGWLQ